MSKHSFELKKKVVLEYSYGKGEMKYLSKKYGLGSLYEKKNTLMQEYSSTKSDMKELYQIRKNYEKYMGRNMER